MKDRESELEEIGGGIVKVRKKVKRSEDSEQRIVEGRGDQEQREATREVEIAETPGNKKAETENIAKSGKESKGAEVENFDLQIQNVVISEIEVIQSEESQKVDFIILFYFVLFSSFLNCKSKSIFI